ncbi:tripartite motif containing 101 isoform X2 [Myripristis murdjan]|uniref:tripartite motif containing 101 isoform X2 n=1 Tax=Myripristis murdjan TaxID=586833 RepID=UPI0011762787|nr:tripartite motif-containing protein 54-like isoform X2 [Myripristis murdjan]
MSVPVELSVLQRCGGAAERAEALGTLHQQLLCPICLDVFTKPVVILPCQHNLCRRCANELYQPSLFQARTTMLVNSGRFRCPSCRQEVVLDRHGVYGLQRNLLVENIIDVYKQEVSSSSSSSSSAPSPLPPVKPLGQPPCSDHEDEKLNIYCLSCQVPTCSLCKVFGAHRSCQVAPLTDVYQQQKDELNEGVASLVAVNNKVQVFIDELEETCRNIEENCKAQKQSLLEKFDSMFALLEERRKAMSQRISSEQEEKTGHAQTLVRCYGDNVEANTKLVESAVRSMDEQDMAAFVQISKDLIKKVIAATTSCPAESLKPGYENMSHYKFNFKRQARALHSIDFIKVEEEVPEEPEPEEPKHLQELTTEQNLEPKHAPESTVQTLEPALEPASEPVQEPFAASAPLAVAASVSPVTRLAVDSVDSVEATAADLRPKTGSVMNDQGAGPAKEKEEVEEVQGEAEEACATSDPVKEGSLCEHQDGMSTQQAVTLLFYLLAFLVILQRVWAYIGCFICT